ncbi:VCBS repeat-containing protein [Rubinisphaera sp.]|uniref:FG-GAP repeat domain-containing protein n=1 Tax=Rubinisphaera sp. TaxID=2024857 RepID=UPI000C118AF1|nr:VCBS repeat-containing protein [Rubinisphaera sp.]MBV09571.1 hypothetical protein [Rubinisphaera sp.]HCS50799.1 VCBS repeat-containing protein [Planctomycetaceae bacterium]|tara:strand:- start:3858 stop:5156 length:1299 start_codon:yes stop_codon:yes gene_type:complete
MSKKLQLICLIGLSILIPAILWRVLPSVPMSGEPGDFYSGGKSYSPSKLLFHRNSLGEKPIGLPVISHVQIVDFDGDGQNEIIVCDVTRSCVSEIRRTESGEYVERNLIENVSAPAHATIVDLNQDGLNDIIVSVLGNILPDDNVIGRVEYYAQTETGFHKQILLEDVRRVADVQSGDFDGDGDLDLAVAVFGYARGEVLWLENMGNEEFLDHQLHSAPGTIHVPVADYDNDGDLDIAAIVSQDEEELWIFENLGAGEFGSRRIWRTVNLDLGSAGLIQSDLDGDGDVDLILPVGDNLEDAEAYPQPYHGCLWFENLGNWEFRMHRISDLGGTYAAEVDDLDGDGDKDVVLVSMTNDWYEKSHASLIWLENDGKQKFTPWQIDNEPIHLVTVATGDINADGRTDVVAGSLNLRKPFERIGRITGWEGTGDQR